MHHIIDKTHSQSRHTVHAEEVIAAVVCSVEKDKIRKNWSWAHPFWETFWHKYLQDPDSALSSFSMQNFVNKKNDKFGLKIPQMHFYRFKVMFHHPIFL